MYIYSTRFEDVFNRRMKTTVANRFYIYVISNIFVYF